MNGNPPAMFEVQAVDPETLVAFYTEVFGWEVERGTGGYAYIRFPPATYSLLGGIGAAAPGVPGRGPGVVFYLQVEDLEATLAVVARLGGATLVGPTTIDGFHFAMFEDPECNQVGIIQPFDGEAPDPAS